MDLTDRINTTSVDEHTTLLKSLNIVSETLEADSTLKAAMQAMAETNTITSGNITSLTELLRNAKLPEILTQLNVKEVASEAEVDPKALCSLKGGKEFLKKQDVEYNEIPGELIINPSLPPHEQVTSLSSSIKRKALELEPEVCIAGLEGLPKDK
ncbi:hypothetical protein Tco_0167621 [Tanacetum coccineum]